MIDDLDEALRQLVIRDLPIKKNDIDITFDQPKSEWSARLSRPTLNIFLHDVRENVKLRRADSQWEMDRVARGLAVERRKPVRVDLHYLITAWAKEPEDEHRLLTRTLMVFFRYQNLPEDVLPESLKDQPNPIPIKVAQYDTLDKPSDIWNVLDNQQRPGFNCVITLALNPYVEITGPIIRTRLLRVGQAVEPAERQRLIEQAGARETWTVGGTVRSKNGPLENLRLRLIERGEEVTLQPEGRFAIGNLLPGDYTLEISAEGRPLSQHKITVPSPDYEIEV